MRARVAATLTLLVAWSALPACRPVFGQETGVTIYRDGRLLVRRTLPVALARGLTTATVDLGVRDADPSSFVALDDGVQITGARVVAATGVEGSLRRSLVSEVVFRAGSDSAPHYLRGTLLSLDPPAVRTDGYVLYGLPGTPVFPDSLVQLQPRVELTVDAARATPALRLMYLSGGLSWAASYALVLPRGGTGQGTMTGTARLDNGGAVSLSAVRVQLLAGDVRRAAPQRGPSGVLMLAARAAPAAGADEASEEAVGGTHVYSLAGTVDFVPGETRTVPLFARTAAAVEPEYVLRQQSFGPTGPWPDAMRDLHPEIGYRVRRPAGTPFGGTALPAGTVRVYQPDASGSVQLMGEATIDHTPAGRDLRLTTGTAFDVTATRSQTLFERRGDRETVSGYRVELQNAGDQAATVAVWDQCPGRCEILASSVPGEQPTAASVSFRVIVPAGGAAALTYQIRARW